jgi:GTP cyclohydrolase I
MTTAATLPDHANEVDHRALAIDRVGIKGLAYPVQVLDRENQTQHTVARLNLYVGLPQQFKGTHMSRFVEILNARRGEITMRNIPALLTEIQRRLQADDAEIEMTFPYFISKRAPVSGVESLMEYVCTFKGAMRGSRMDFVLGVQVPVKSLCPCSKSISQYGAHNQRSLVDVEVRSDEHVWIEDIAAAVERCASAPIFALLKREDEKYITELAYDNPKFVEDLVRDVVIAVRALPGVRWLRVSADNQESIHNHSAYAQLEWSADEAARHGPLAFTSPGGPAEPTSFGQWLRHTRTNRGFTQQDLAEALQVSAAHLSRVESGEKHLSEPCLNRLAEVLGMEADDVLLRAGVVPDRYRSAVAADPEGFRRWAETAYSTTDTDTTSI